jgi:tight adherence protein C
MIDDPSTRGLLVAGLAFVFAAAGGAALIGAFEAQGARTELERRFVRLMRGLSAEPSERRVGPLGWLVRVGTAWQSRVQDRRASLLLVQAGWRGREAAAVFAASRLLAPLGCGLGAGAFGILLSGGTAGLAPLGTLALAAALVGYATPMVALRARARRRMRVLREEMIPLAHLMSVLYEVGLSSKQLIQVLADAGRRVLPEASRELAEISRLVAAGRGFPEATRDVTESMAAPELTDLFAVVRQVERQGGSVKGSLLDYAELLGDRERTRLHEAVGRLSGQLTVVMVLFLMPALLVFVGGPGYTAIIRALGRGAGE